MKEAYLHVVQGKMRSPRGKCDTAETILATQAIAQGGAIELCLSEKIEVRRTPMATLKGQPSAACEIEPS